MEALRNDKFYTYADYATWDTKDRYELIAGEPYMIASPSNTHQRILGELHRQIANFLVKKTCTIRIAPFDVRLSAEGDNDRDVVQPDIVVVCDRSKLDEKGLNGAPDMVIEIVSPSTESHDRVRKFNKYLQAGIREYWVISPDSKTVTVFILQNGTYIAQGYGETDTVPVHVLEGCEISLPDVFTED